MKLLLDTHAFLWFVWDDARLSAAARQAIEDPANAVLLSPASYWEMAIKISLGNLTLADPLEQFLQQHTAQNRIAIVPISFAHVACVSSLPFFHRDPFDRMLAAQATVEQMPLLSRDIAFDPYSVTRLW